MSMILFIFIFYITYAALGAKQSSIVDGNTTYLSNKLSIIKSAVDHKYLEKVD